MLSINNEYFNQQHRIDGILDYYSQTEKYKFIAALGNHEYVVHDPVKKQRRGDRRIVIFRSLAREHKHEFKKKLFNHCRVFVEDVNAFLKYVKTLHQHITMDLEYTDENIVILHGSINAAEISNWKPGVIYMECDHHMKLHNLHGYKVVMEGLDITSAHVPGFVYGEGSIVTVIDTGLDVNHCSFMDKDSSVPYSTLSKRNIQTVKRELAKYTHRKLIGYLSLSFENMTMNSDFKDAKYGHGTHTGGTVSYRGYNDLCPYDRDMLYRSKAKILFVDVQKNDEANIDNPHLCMPASMRWMFKGAYELGSRIISCSFGSSNITRYTMASFSTDSVIYENPYLSVIISAGNDGPSYGTIGSPGDAKNAITIGASSSSKNFYIDNNNETISGKYTFDESDIQINADAYQEHCVTDFSSRGPTYDNRIKPDILAPGFLLSAMADPASGLHSDRVLMRGTSMSAPLVAGIVPVIDDVILARSNEPPINALRKSLLVTFSTRKDSCMQATKVEGTRVHFRREYPTAGLTEYDYGHGVLDLSRFLHGEFDYRVFDLRTTDKPYAICLRARESCVSFKVSMVYDDPPTVPGSDSSLVNDFNLRALVYDMNGNVTDVREGNGKPMGEFDSHNNVEAITIPHVEQGQEIRIEVAPNGIISQLPGFEDKHMAVSWNGKMEVIPCARECEKYSLPKQCFTDGDIQLKANICSGGNHTYNEKSCMDYKPLRKLDPIIVTVSDTKEIKNTMAYDAIPYTMLVLVVVNAFYVYDIVFHRL